MKQAFNIWEWFTRMGSITKILVSIISLGIGIAGWIALHDAKVIRKFNEKNEETAKKKQIETVISNQSIEAIQSKRRDSAMFLEITNVKSIVDEHATTLKALDKSYVLLLREDKQYDILFQYLKDIESEVKKNE